MRPPHFSGIFVNYNDPIAARAAITPARIGYGACAATARTRGRAIPTVTIAAAYSTAAERRTATVSGKHRRCKQHETWEARIASGVEHIAAS